MKLFALVMCAMLLVGMLAACGDDSDTTSPTSNNQQTTADISGTIMLNVNACVNISFDENGKVLNIMDVDTDGHELLVDYSGYLQTGCADVVKELVQISEGLELLTREFNNIIIKEQPGSTLPSENFLADLAAAAEEAAEIPVDVTVITVADQNADGQINADKAFELLLKALDVETIDLVAQSAEPIEGTYVYVIASSTLSSDYLVDATTGYVYEGTVEDFDYSTEETEPSEEEGEIPTEETTLPVIEESLPEETIENITNPVVEDEE